MHAPPTQFWLVVHARPQLPQFIGSLVSRLQPLPHAVREGPHSQVFVAVLQTVPKPEQYGLKLEQHTSPKAPQQVPQPDDELQVPPLGHSPPESGWHTRWHIPSVQVRPAAHSVYSSHAEPSGRLPVRTAQNTKPAEMERKHD